MKARLIRIGSLASVVVSTLAAAAGATFAGMPRAFANGRFPAANQLVVQPGKPERLLLRTTFGLLYSDDRGANWRWVCEALVGYGGPVDPAVALFANGATLAGLIDSLAIGSPTACDWRNEFPNQAFIDVALIPQDPHGAVAVTNTSSGVVDGSVTFLSEVRRTTNDGTTWELLGGKLDPSLIVETIDVAPSNPKRMYLSAIRGDADTTGGFFLVSDDEGKTWVEKNLPLDLATERAPYIAAIDPTNADRVYVRTSGKAGDAGFTGRILVTDDAGATWKTAFSGGKLLGFALSADGSKVFVGGPVDGLHVADKATLVFRKQSSIQIECLTTSGTTLYACSNEGSGFIVGASEDDGVSFKGLLNLNTVRGPLQCPQSTDTVCLSQWPTVARELGVPLDSGSDAASPSADASLDGGTLVDGGQGSNGGDGSGGGCSEGGAPSGETRNGIVAAAGLFAGWLLSKRLRRAVRSP